ncbi:MAG: hypothetical protein NUW37_16980 [Planctomycetes bacterium]|nr:hypothetical protein [Planctomycetota bacterium]
MSKSKKSETQTKTELVKSLTEIKDKSLSFLGGMTSHPWFYKIALMGLSITLTFLLISKLEGYASSSPEFQLHPKSIDISVKDVQSWAKGEWGAKLETAILSELSSNIEKEGPMNLFERGLCDRIAKRFEQSPWVSYVANVERRYPATISVNFKLRKPRVAVKLVSGSFAIIDGEGYRIPIIIDNEDQLATLKSELVAPLMTVLGVQSEPAAVGGCWKDDGVRLAIVLDKELQDDGLYEKLPVIAIDVRLVSPTKDASVDPCLILVTPEGSAPVRYGFPESERQYGEPTAETKLRNLETILGMNETLEGYSYVDLRFNPPLTPAQRQGRRD